MRATIALALFVLLTGADADAPGAHSQPSWDRRDESKGKIHSLLERAARQHQEGDLVQATTLLRQVLKLDSQHGEAYASLSKCYADQGKYDMARKAMEKASKLHNEQLSSFSLF